MSFLDNIGKSINQGLDRARFEAEKFQKVARIQGEIADLRKRIDARRMELGDRALDLYKAGQISSVTLGEIVTAIEGLRASITVKEEELKSAQAEKYVEPAAPPGALAQSQQVPISVEQSPAQPVQPPPAVGRKACPNCGFQMPGTALFCPSCGTRVSA